MLRWLFAVLLFCAPADLVLAQNAGLPADLARLVPADAVALVVLRSAREVALQLESARLRAGIESEGIDEQSVLTNFLEGYPADVAQLDAARPVGIAFRFAINSMQPEPVFIVPALDATALLKALGSLDRLEPPLGSGGYVGISMGGLAHSNDRPSRLIDGMPAGLAVARVDLGAAIKKFRPAIDAALEQVEQLSDSGQLGGRSSTLGRIDMYLELARDIADSADLLQASLDRRSGELSLALSMSNRPGSPLAKYAVPEIVDYRALACRLDPGAAMSVLTSYDSGGTLESIWATYGGLFDTLESSPGGAPQFVKALRSYTQHSKDLMPKFGRVAATSFDFGGSGARVAACYLSPDPQGLLKGLLAMLRDPALADMGIASGETQEIELGGVKATSFRPTVDLKKFVAAVSSFSRAAGSEKQPAEEELVRFESFMGNFFGKQGARVAYLQAPACASFLLGGDDAWRVDLAKRLGGSVVAPATLLRSVDALTGTNPAMFLQLDIARCLAGLASWMPTLGVEESPVRDVSRLAGSLGTQALPASLYFGATTADWKAGASIDFDGLLRLLRANSDSERADRQWNQARRDILEISSALEHYVPAHGGKFPDSLEELTEKDANGNSILPTLSKDPWGRSYIYEKSSGEGKAFRVRTLGADGVEGGSGENADWDNSTANPIGNADGEEKPFVYKVF